MLKIPFSWISPISLATSAPTKATVLRRTLSWLLVLQVALQAPGCYAQNNAQNNQKNTTIPLTNPQSGEVVYTPSFCNATTAAGNPQSCAGAWQSGFSDSGVPIVTSAGQNAATGNILPQIFFRFRASRVFVNMDPTSGASINITVSSNDITIMNTVQASLGTATIVNLPNGSITTLTITLLPSPPNPFSLFSVVITTPFDADPTSVFPTQTLPVPTPVSTWYNPSTTSYATTTITMPNSAPTATPTTSSNRHRMIAQAVGITVGLGLGLTAILVAAFFYWKKRRRIARLWRRSASRVEFD
ncbi:hypothetical protein DFP72DRAFT_1062037 [Ephemerocybe angulata]|uniref:Reelin domain-containing protein n=1 Tax=Ephemerocybe angulata TaxID=980116 RepID=A0A8H6IB19_9AGAR|nr:hypothetical protein DFP72DRAFT_1062037 [Tulosesus angulatus]